MAVLLESDRNTPAQGHLDELAARTTVVFVVTGVLTVVWSFFVDEVLVSLMNRLQPCTGDCLNVYDPAQWSAVRWTTALLLALISSAPVAVYHLLSFSKPGLLPNEYIALKRWIFSGFFVVSVLAYILMADGLPWLYQVGFEQHTEAGLAAQYSAIDMLNVALYLIWVVMVATLTWLLIIMIGHLQLLTSATADWWRWRMYGMGSLLLVLTVPEAASSATLPLLVLYVVTSEWIGSGWIRTLPASVGEIKERFDGEGRRRRISVLDCSCAGANAHAQGIVTAGCATVHVEALCLRQDERERILEHVFRTASTDAIITGCDGTPCPAPFLRNLNAMGVQVWGLDLMNLQNHRVDHPPLILEQRLAMLGLYESVSNGVHEHERVNLFEQHEIDPPSLHEIEGHGWGTYFPDTVLLMQRPHRLDQ